MFFGLGVSGEITTQIVWHSATSSSSMALGCNENPRIHCTWSHMQLSIQQAAIVMPSTSFQIWTRNWPVVQFS